MVNKIFKEDEIVKCESDTAVGYEEYIDGVCYRVTDDSNLQTDIDNDKDLCTTFVTDLSSLFYDGANSTYLDNHDITTWDVSSVTNMQSLFNDPYWEFNQDISNWDVSSVTNMRSMFYKAGSFYRDISNWDVSNVTDMANMFAYNDFTEDIGGWDVHNVTDMDNLFKDRDGPHVNIDLSKWAVPNIGSLPSSFNNDGANPDWGTTKYPHIKFQAVIGAPIVIHVYTDSSRTAELSNSPVTANKRGFTQMYVPNDDTTYYYDGYGILEGSFSVAAGTSSTDMLNTFMTVVPDRYYGTKELKMMTKDGWMSINDHNQLPNYVSTEHIDWSTSQTENIHTDNYTDTTYVSSDFDHDSLTNYNADEHIDWTDASDDLQTTGTIKTGNVTISYNSTDDSLDFTFD